MKNILFKSIKIIIYVVLFIICLEILLTIIGKFFLIYRTYDTDLLEKTGNVKIACFGDSYTYGGLGFRGNSYPGFLNNMCESAVVVNNGICESNSTQVLNTINNYLLTNHPDVIVLLVGSSNKYNFYGMNKSKFYQKFRIYKVYQIFKLICENIKLKKDIVFSAEDESISGYYLSNDIINIIDDVKSIDKKQGVVQQIYYYMALSSNRNQFVVDTNRYKQEIKILINSLNIEEKKSIAKDMIRISAFLQDKDKFLYYYDIYSDINPIDARVLFLQNLMCFQEFDEDDNIRFGKIDEIITLDPKIGYLIGLDYLFRKIPLIKDNNKKIKKIELVKKYINKYSLINNDKKEIDKLKIKYYIIMADFYEAERLFKSNINNFDDGFKRDYYIQMAYNLIYNRNFSDAVYCFLQAFKQKNNFFEYNQYYYFAKACDLQSKYSMNFILEELKSVVEHNDRLKDNEYLNTILESLKEKNKFENEILQWLERDLDTIIQICKSKDIKLILQTYPFPYNAVNDVIRKVAKKYKLLLIDQNVIFNKLVDEGVYYDYFLDFDHCTDMGHKIMASNIYELLIKNNIIKN